MKKLFNSRWIGITLTSSAMACVLVLGVAHAEERHGPGDGQSPAMGQQSQGPGSYGQAPYGSATDADLSGRMMQQGESSGDPGRSQGQGYVDGPGFGSGHQGYEEAMKRSHEQRTEIKQERRESREEGRDDGRKTGGE